MSAGRGAEDREALRGDGAEPFSDSYQAPAGGSRALLPGRLPALSGGEGSRSPLDAESEAHMAEPLLSGDVGGREGADPVPGKDYREARTTAHPATGGNREMSKGDIEVDMHTVPGTDLSEPSAEHRPNRHPHHHAHPKELPVAEHSPEQGRAEKITPAAAYLGSDLALPAQKSSAAATGQASSPTPRKFSRYAPASSNRALLPVRLPALSGVEGSSSVPLEAEVKAQKAEPNVSADGGGRKGADPGEEHRPARPAAMQRVMSDTSVKNGRERVARLRHNNSAADLSSQPSTEHRPSHHRHHHHHHHAHCNNLVVPEYGPGRGRTEQITPLSNGLKKKFVRLMSASNTVVPTTSLWNKSDPNKAGTHGADEQGGELISRQAVERVSQRFSKLTQAPSLNNRRLMNRPVYDLETPEHENNCLCCFVPVIHPLSKLRNYWDFIVILLVVYTSLVLPMRTAFLWVYDEAGSSINGWTITDITIDFLFLLDVVMNFNTGYIREPDFVTVLSRKEIAKNYAKGWFCFDILSSLPLDLIIFGQSQSAVKFPRILRFIRAVRLLKVLRLTRVVRYLQRLPIFAGMSTFSMRISKLFIFCVFFLHWNACLQFLVAAATGFPEHCWVENMGIREEPVIVQYSWSLFLATSHMFCIGYGPMYPVLIQEARVIMISYIMGAFIFAKVLVGIITSVMLSADANNSKFLEKQERLNQYMAHRKLPLDLRQRIRDSMEYKWRTRRALDENSIIDCLPSGLRSDVCLYVCSALIKKVSFFQFASEGVIESLVLNLRPDVFLAMEVIIKQGTQAKEMFFLNTGRVKITANGIDVAECGEGGHFGEIGILRNAPRITTCTAMTDCEVFILTKQAFDDMLHDFPEYKAKFTEIAEERIREIGFRSEFRSSLGVVHEGAGEDNNAADGDGWTPPDSRAA